MTPLLNSNTYSGAFPNCNQQPSWLAKVLTGAYGPATDFFGVNGSPVPVNQVVSQLGSTPSAASFIVYIIELVGQNMDYSQYTCANTQSTGSQASSSSSACQMGVQNVQGSYALGPFSAGNVLSAPVSTKPTTQAIIITFRLYLIGTWNQVPFQVTYNGNSAFSSPLSGSNQWINVEMQVPCSGNNAGNLTYGVPSQGASGNQGQWAISDIVIVFSITPVGTVYSPATGDNEACNGSYMTPLLNTIYPGYFQNAATQPCWLNQALQGAYTPSTNIFVVAGVIVPVSQVLNQVHEYTLGVALIPYVMGLSSSSPTMDTSAFSCGCQMSVMPVQGVNVLGSFAPGDVLATQVIPQANTQSAVVTFRLYLIGTCSQAPFSMNYNGASVLNTPVSGTNQHKDVEVQFPCSNSASGNNALTFTQSASSAESSEESSESSSDSSNNCQWAISDIVVVLSNTPVGTIYSTLNGATQPITGSYMTPLLNNIYGGSFPTATQQPIWLMQALNGNLNSQQNIVVVNGVIISLTNVATSTPSAVTGVANSPNLNNYVSVVLMLISSAPTMDYSMYTCASQSYTSQSGSQSAYGCQMGVNTIQGVQALGPFSGPNVLSQYLTPLASTQAVVLRFTLYMVGVWQNTPFQVSYNGAPVFTSPLSGNNTSIVIEIQFVGGQYGSNALNFGLQNGNQYTGVGASQSPQWAIGEVVIVYSNSPVGTIASPATGVNQPVTGSYITVLLLSIYGGSFPGYTNQPSWLSSALNASPSQQNVMVVISGLVVVVPSGSNQGTVGSTAPQYGTSPSYANQLTIIIELIGQNMDFSSYTCVANQGTTASQSGSNSQTSASQSGSSSQTGASQSGSASSNSACQMSVQTVQGVPALSGLTSGSLLSYQLVPTTSTQSVALRFTIYLVGTWSQVPFTVSYGNSPVFSTPLTGSDTYINIEIVFAVGTTSSGNGLTFGVAPTYTSSSPLQWAIGQMVIVMSPSPVGQIYSPTTQQNTPVSLSYFTPLLTTILGGSFPTATTQPTWLTVVLGNNLNNVNNIIVVNGQLVALPSLPYTSSPSVGSSPSTPYNMYVIIYLLTGSNQDSSSFTSPCTLSSASWNGHSTAGVVSSSNSGASASGASTTGVSATGASSTTSNSGCTQLSYPVTPQANTQSVVIRFRLYIIGSWAQIPFQATYNGVPVLSTPITGNNQWIDIEIQFPVSSTATSPSNSGLSFGISPSYTAPQGQTTPQFTISDFVLVLSTAPCGQVASPNGQTTTNAPSSYFTVLLNLYTNGVLPGYTSSVLPVWYNKVLNNLYNTGKDIIAQNGVIVALNFGQATNNGNQVGSALGSTNQIPFSLLLSVRIWTTLVSVAPTVTPTVTPTATPTVAPTATLLAAAATATLTVTPQVVHPTLAR